MYYTNYVTKINALIVLNGHGFIRVKLGKLFKGTNYLFMLNHAIQQQATLDVQDKMKQQVEVSKKKWLTGQKIILKIQIPRFQTRIHKFNYM